jgi:hypothetical protein
MIKLTKKQQKEWQPWIDLAKNENGMVLRERLENIASTVKAGYDEPARRLVGAALSVGKWLNPDLTYVHAGRLCGLCYSFDNHPAPYSHDLVCPECPVCEKDMSCFESESVCAEALRENHDIFLRSYGKAREKMTRLLIEIYNELYEEYFE